MKKFSERQKYLIIMWHYLLTDLQKNDIENIIKDEHPGFEIDWGFISKMISWAADFKNIREDLYPWRIHVSNKNGELRHFVF